ncbi:phosphoribosylformylglycinamidine cyclo-ligase [Kamptonema cortianum]|nr:phosphoribosylformylglycinamidine cyclo-ligase [Oscillatoria laete-virens]MDK3160322.1 phosphoribosylformylglycinamidine cyclo-ligase [Kamptonema cortianum]MDL5053705.1 phosphoribosylformylglycinamidine cyclo-ligase [Oscillatoria laete-virens NRMC-F 0139]
MTAKKAYAQAGVDVDLGNRVKSGLGKLLAKTKRPEVLGKVGGFGGLFRADFRKFKDPVLVASVDGVGTKLKIAIETGQHDTIGADLVNHCVNDIAVLGAEPLFFLDYIGTGKLDPKVFEQIVSGLARACAAANCALIGGETAQMPGVYQGKDYDLVGSIVGIVDRAKMIDGSKIREGDIIIGLESSGLHTNGYSLARKILFEKLRLRLSSKIPGEKEPLGKLLLRTHINYLPAVQALSRTVTIKAMAHITGGGLVDNLPRVLPKKVNAFIDRDSWPVPPLYQLLCDRGGVSQEERYQTFNMGIGYCFVVAAKDADKSLSTLRKLRARPHIIGQIEKGTGIVRIV